MSAAILTVFDWHRGSGSVIKGPYSSSTWQTTSSAEPSSRHSGPAVPTGRNSGPPVIGSGNGDISTSMPTAAALSSAASAPPGFPPAPHRSESQDVRTQLRGGGPRPGMPGGSQAPPSLASHSPQPFANGGPDMQPAGMAQASAVMDIPTASRALVQAVQQQQQQQAAVAAAAQTLRPSSSPSRATPNGGLAIPVPPPSVFQSSGSHISSPQGYDSAPAGALSQATSGAGVFDTQHQPGAGDSRAAAGISNAALAAALSQANPAALYNIPAAAYESFAAAMNQGTGAFSPPPQVRRASSNVADEYRIMELSDTGAAFFATSAGMAASASYGSLPPNVGGASGLDQQRLTAMQQQAQAAALATSQQMSLAAMEADQQAARHSTSAVQMAASQHIAKLEATHKLAASKHLAASQQLAAAQNMVAVQQQMAAASAVQAHGFDGGHLLGPLSRTTSAASQHAAQQQLEGRVLSPSLQQQQQQQQAAQQQV